ncbi:hypothetical protein DFH11DRAFT_1135326 [Phellopilus nigrolimitatus]|nr:hypothetical protein DFH11DRAFT_1135326 [Phellopilus nigrolimitatus]
MLGLSTSSKIPNSLPPELWTIIIRYATSPSLPLSLTQEYSLAEHCYPVESPHPEYDDPLTPVHYHSTNEISSRSNKEAFVKIEPKLIIARVCRSFSQIVSEFLYETIYISSSEAAHQLAETLEFSTIFKNPGKWARHVTFIGSRFSPSSSADFTSAALRILARTPNLISFRISWSGNEHTFREHEERIIESVPTACLRHFEWRNASEGFVCQPQHAFYQLLRRTRLTLRVLKLSGYLPLKNLKSTEAVVSLPALTHLSVRRPYRDDFALISSWDISSHLTCLNLGSLWRYFDNREIMNTFWETPKPMLRCLRLGEDTAVCLQLVHKILNSSPRLQMLEYYYLGDWDTFAWAGVRHESLESVIVHTSHPMIKLRSLFNTSMHSREHQWERLLRHVRPFLRPREDAEIAEGTVYPAMKRLTLVEYSCKFEGLQYDPPELVEWLRSAISRLDYKSDVEFCVDLQDID